MEDNQQVWTVTRSREKAVELREAGMEAIQSDGRQWGELSRQSDLPNFDSVTVSIGNDGRRGEDHDSVYLAATHAALALAGRSGADRPCPVMLVSTTGVYAPPEAVEKADATVSTSPVDWVAEDAPLGPRRPGAAASYRCEQRLLQQSDVPVFIFRLAGIYALDRIPNLNRLRADQPIQGSGDGWLNLIHVQDAAAILAWAVSTPPPWSIVNVADGVPVRRRAFYEFLSQTYGTPPPRFEGADGGRGGGKRIDVARLQQWYGGPWLFPDYRSGLVGDKTAPPAT